MGVSRLVPRRIVSVLSIVLGCTAVLLAVPADSSAQYMYLDTDGDGVLTPADALAPSGATAVDVWLRTDAGRDGVPAVCSSGDAPFSILGYGFVLRVANGTVSFGGFVNRMPGFGAVGEASSATEYSNGAIGGAPLAPGLYRLATVNVTPGTGTPSLEIVANSTLPGGGLTGFYSECLGLDFDGSLKLGVDWADADGVPYGGQVNRTPAIDPISDVFVAEGATATAALHASDPDGDPLAFSLAAGPSFATVVTVDPGAGIAEGRVDLAPGFDVAGDHTVTVRASDGFLAGEASFTVRVEGTNRPVAIGTVPFQVVREGRTAMAQLIATDPDNDEIDFGIASGPSYVSVRVLVNRSPAVAEIRISPGFAAAGVATVVVFATDGATTAETSFQVTVLEAFDYVPPVLAAIEDAALAAGATAERALHGRGGAGGAVTFALVEGPAFASVSTSSTDPSAAAGTLRLTPGPGDVGFYEVKVGASDGSRSDVQSLQVTVVEAGAAVPPGPDNFDASFLSYETGDTPQALAVGDLDGDGNADVGLGALDGTLTLWFGSPDGRMRRRQTYTLGGNPYSVAIGDVNRDGLVDLAVADSVSDVVTILPGRGAGLFGDRVDLSCGTRTAHVSLGDLNGDGNLDVVAANEGEASISVLLGHGDFTFERGVTYPVGQDPCYTRIADLNRDGLADVAVANEMSSSVSILLGAGAGVLAPQVQYATAIDPRSVVTGDLNGDGVLDLAVPAFDANQISILIGHGDGSFAPHQDFDSGSCPWAITLADFNRDARLDVATANVCDDNVSVFLGDGSGRFETRTDIFAGGLTRFLRSGDLNRDGRPDLAVCNEGSSTLNIFLGNGDGTFGAVTFFPIDEAEASGTVADLNGDGSLDVAVPHTSGKIGLYFNDGRGSIGATAELSGFERMDFILVDDWTVDGVADLVVGTSAGDLWLYRGAGAGAFEGPESIPFDGHATSAVAVRADSDGLPDLVVGNSEPNAIVALKGRGDGTFEPGAALPMQGIPFRLAPGDWNGDGKLDVAVAEIRSADAIGVALGDGAGGFVQGPRRVTEDLVGSIALHDADGDGATDLIASIVPRIIFLFEPYQGYMTIFRGDGGDGLVDSGERYVGWSPHSFVIHDFDGSSREDLAFANGFAHTASLLPAVPGSDFGALTAFGASGPMYGLAGGDWDGDGDTDLIASGQSRVAVLRNRGYQAEPTVAVRLFLTEENQTLRLAGRKPTLCVQVEPVNGSFQVTDVDLGTVVLKSAETGSVDEIHAIQGKEVGSGDRDRNGVSEIAACFAHGDLAALFDGVRGSVDLVVTLEGRLFSGERFSGPVELTVVGAPHQALAVGVSPNPMNPVGALTVTTPTGGSLRVTLHDPRGRLIAEVARQRFVPAGEYRFFLGGDSGGRGALASGIYFYRVEAAGGVRTGKLTVLK